MKKLLISLLSAIAFVQPMCADTPRAMTIQSKPYYDCSNWMAYGTFVLNPYTNTDNPPTNLLGLEGEVTLPYLVPEGHYLIIDYLQVEGPDGPQVGMALWLGNDPCMNEKCIISCTTPGGSTQLDGMKIKISEGQLVNIRVMNNTAIPWVNGFFLQGKLYSSEQM